MGHVALLTLRDHPLPATRDMAWAEDRALLDALAARGVDARHVPWGGDLEGASVAVIRTVWDYPWQADAFLAWVDRAAQRVPVWNPPKLVRWNAHKSYLFDLERQGIPITPGVRVLRGRTTDVAALLREHGELVIKPTVDAGAMNAKRVRDVADAEAHLRKLAAEGEVLVQPFLRRIATEGERSLLYFGGRFSHAVRKRPAAGDYRVQAAYGGTVEPHAPTAAEKELALRVLAVAGPTLHARVDVVTDNEGRPCLIELEAIEPYFFMQHAPEAAARYADAVAALTTR